MNTAPTAESRFELLQSDDFSQYLLHDKREVVYILRQLAAKRCMITAYYGELNHFLMTSVVGLSQDERKLFIDVGKNEKEIAEAVASKQLVCVTQLDKIKVQFALHAPEPTQFDRFPALQTPVPDVLLRLQRREYYRLATPSYSSLVCQIPAPGSDQVLMEVNIVDISGGGIAVVAPPTGVDFQPEMTFPKCRLILPDHGIITATLKVKNVFKMTNPNGIESIRIGCQFLNLPVQMANTIQRYILKEERDRKLRGLV